MRCFWAPAAHFPSGSGTRVRFTVAAGRFTAVEAGVDPRPGDERLSGVVLPGLANAHSHAFHRALRGRSQGGGGTFWTWRRQMYAVAARLDPDSYLDLARALYAEMALAGITVVGEFHYLHHGPGGRPYADPNAMGAALIQAASEAGIRLTLLDTCYLRGGLDADGHSGLDEVQRRFGDGDVDRWAARVALMQDTGVARIGAAAHSVRALSATDLGMLAERVADRPVHAHLSEQPAENQVTQARYGCSPTQLLHRSGLLGPRCTVVHATHLSSDDVGLLGGSASTACFCPTTERDLADGIGPARSLLDAGSPLALGSDQHAVLDPFEELRGLEMHERLSTGRRGVFSPAELLEAASGAGYASLGWPDGGRLAVGAFADFVVVRTDTVRTAGCAADQIGYAATAADVDRVLVDGRDVVTEGRHRLGAIGPQLADALAALHGGTAVSGSTLVTGVGELVTCDDTGPDGLGLRQHAAVVVEEATVVWVGDAAAAPPADRRLDLDGRTLLPGFVDSHSHLVFDGDRSAEFAARMAGRRYDGGGIAMSVAATRAASDDELRRLVGRRVAEMRSMGTTTVEIKSGYGQTVADEVRALAIAAEFTPETTFLGAHVVPPAFADDRAGFVDLVTGPMLRAAAPYARWVDVFCEPHSPYAFRADEARAVLGAGRDAGLGLRVHGNQLAPGPGVQLAVELGAASVDHCTYLSGADRDALVDARDQTVATLLPGVEFSTRSPYPDAAGLLRAGASIALATDCNPGTCYSSSMPFVIALAVREMGLTPGQAVYAATAGGARALRRGDIGRIEAGARADFAVLDAPSHVYLSYRAGVPLSRTLELG